MADQAFVFNQKTLTGIKAGLGVSGGLLFGLGVLVGMWISTRNQSAPADVAAAVTADRTATTDTRSAPPPIASAPIDDAAGWPFSSRDTMVSATTSTTYPTAIDSFVPSPIPVVPVPPGSRSGTLEVSYTEPAGDAPILDRTPYIVQVGAFRSEQNAARLAARLKTAGYRPIVETRLDGARMLHVVRVGRVVGRDEADRVALRIGNSENLVAVVRADPRG